MLLLLNTASGIRAQDNPALQFYHALNDIRLAEGHPPLGWSKLLEQAAQRHAVDIAEMGKATSEGSDGSDHRQRIRETGYRAWHDGLLVKEAVWMGLGAARDALNWFRSDLELWEMFITSRYREIGVGYAADDQGVHYFVIDLGVRPGVLPVFINDGAEVTDSPQVAVRLTNEEAEPLGEGAWMGKAIEVRLNNNPDFVDAVWQPWEPLLPWVLEGTEPGEYAVYVEYRDGAGRTSVAEDTIRLVAQGETPPEPTPWRDAVLPPATATATLEAQDGPTTMPTPVALTPPTAITPEALSLTQTPILTPRPGQSSDDPRPSASEMTLVPTWTPLPTPDEHLEARHDWPLLVLIALHGLAVLLGGAVFLRRH
jgi:hypothetical protein